MIVACQKRGTASSASSANASACRAAERVLSWNVRGPGRPAGPPWARGNPAPGPGRPSWATRAAQGRAGASGPAGPAGPGRRRRDPLARQARPPQGPGPQGRPDPCRSPRSTGRPARGSTARPARSTSSRRRRTSSSSTAPAAAALRLRRLPGRGSRHQRGRLRPGRDGRRRLRRAEEHRRRGGHPRRDRGRARERRRRRGVRRVALTGSLAAGAYLVVPVEMQNGAPDGVALIDTATKALLDALSYEGEIHAATIDGQVYDLVEGTPLPATVADSNTVDGSLSRLPDGDGHERRRRRLGVHDDEDPGGRERRVPVALRASRARPSAPGAGALAPLEPLLELRELTLEIAVALPPLGREARRPRAPPRSRTRARPRGGSPRTGTLDASSAMSSNASSSPSSASQRWSSRMPGLSTTMPPPGRSTSSRRVVVCRPEPSSPRCPFARSSSPTSTFTSVDLPTPEGPRSAPVTPGPAGAREPRRARGRYGTRPRDGHRPPISPTSAATRSGSGSRSAFVSRITGARRSPRRA